MYLNKMFVAGNLTRDPELTTTPAGLVVCKFSVATNETYYNKQTNQKVENVEFHNLVAFGKQAETIKQYFAKGKPIFVEGKLKTSSWEDKDTQKKMYRTEIIVNEFKFMNDGGKSKEQSSNEDYETEASNTGHDVVEYPDEDVDESQIPF